MADPKPRTVTHNARDAGRIDKGCEMMGVCLPQQCSTRLETGGLLSAGSSCHPWRKQARHPIVSPARSASLHVARIHVLRRASLYRLFCSRPGQVTSYKPSLCGVDRRSSGDDEISWLGIRSGGPFALFTYLRRLLCTKCLQIGLAASLDGLLGHVHHAARD